MRKALIALLVTAAWGAGSAQTKINPTTQINWPLITGAGTPTSLSIACSSTNYGQPFQNTAVTPNTYYTCGTDGWAVRGGSDSNAVTMASPFTGIYSIPISAGTGRAQVDSGLEFDTSMDQLEFRGGPFNINNVVIHDAVLDGSAISNTSIGSSSPAQGTFTQIDLAPTGVATSSANFPSSIIQFDSSQWNGSAPVTLQWKAQSIPSPSSGVGTFDMLKFSHGGSLASYGISIPSLYLTNLTSGNCLQATTGGQVVDTGTPCGSSGGGISALTGDVTASGSGSVPATLATVSSTFGSCGDATHVCQVTTNAKGLTTSQSAVAITAGGITQLTGAVLAGPSSGSVASTIANLGASGNLPMSNGSGTFTPSGITFDSLGDMNDVNSFNGLLGLTVLNTDCTVNSGTAIELAGENTGGNGGLFLQHNTSCYSGTNPNMTNTNGPSLNSITSEDGLPLWIVDELGGPISIGQGTGLPNIVVNPTGQTTGGSGVALPYFGGTSAGGMAGGILASLPSTAPGGGAGVPGEVVLATTAQKTITINSTACVLGGTCTVTTTSPISGATAGQALIAGSATTATSSIPINGAGAGLVTGPAAPTSGDVAFFTGGAGAITDGLIAGANLVTAASALTANQIVLGAGSKTTAVLGSLGTTTTVLHGNASGAPSFGAVALSTDVTGTLPPGNFVVATTCPTCGITGSPLSQFASTTSAQLAGVLSDETGTGSAVFATSPTLVTPALGTPASGVITNLTGTCAACSIGGNAATATSTTTATNLSGGVLGSTPYQTAASTTAFVAPNTSATKEFYSMTGTGSAGASPAWGVLLAADIPTITLAQVSAGTVVGSGGTFAFGTNTVSIGTALTNTNFRSPNGTTNQNFGVMSGGNWTASAPFFLINPPVVSSSLAGTPSQFSTTGTFSNTGTSTGSWTGMVLNNTFGAGTSNVYNGSAPIEQLNLTPTINVATTSTNGYVGLMMNVTETSISAGATNYLARLQVGGADRFTVTNAGFANAVQLNSTLGSGTVTATPATGVTSVTCQTATCNVNGGTYTVVGGTATTGTFTTFTWPTTTTAWRCTTSMNGGGTFLGLGHSVATATGMTVSSAVTILSTTFTFDYSCQP